MRLLAAETGAAGLAVSFFAGSVFAGSFFLREASGTPAAGSTAVAGSGGDYLSNEIFYRTRLLRDSSGLSVPMGHLHTPVLAAPSPALGSSTFHAERDAIVARIRQILIATIPSL